MTYPNLIYINRVIDPRTQIHYLDALDTQGRHWMAQMSHQEEDWIVYTETWKLDPQKFYD
jgi:hypothetical protein